MEGPSLEVVVFEVGGQQFGLPASDVRELQRAATVTPLPRAPAVVEGVVNLRGTVVPVLDIRARFRLPPKPMQHTDHFVVAAAGERLVALRVDRATLETEFLKLAEAEGVSDIEELNKILERAVTLKNMLKNRDRVNRVARFVAEHFQNTVEPMGYKGFLVAVDREACVLYKEALDKYLPPEWSQVVISSGGKGDSDELRRHHLEEAEEQAIRQAFRKPSAAGPASGEKEKYQDLRILIVDGVQRGRAGWQGGRLRLPAQPDRSTGFVYQEADHGNYAPLSQGSSRPS